VTPGPVVASQTGVTVPDGTAGVTTAIDITLKDEFGNPVPGAAGQITVAVTGPNAGSTLSVSDQGGGNYRAQYEPHVAGTDQIDVRVGGQPVSGSPFASAVKVGPPDPGRTTAVVPDGRFGQPVNILVFLTDAQGNRIATDPAVVQVDILGIGPQQVVYVGDGIYLASWTPRVIGNFKVNIAVNGTPIAGSPFTMHIGFF
jgi:adhesin/invasin